MIRDFKIFCHIIRGFRISCNYDNRIPPKFVIDMYIPQKYYAHHIYYKISRLQLHLNIVINRIGKTRINRTYDIVWHYQSLIS